MKAKSAKLKYRGRVSELIDMNDNLEFLHTKLVDAHMKDGNSISVVVMGENVKERAKKFSPASQVPAKTNLATFSMPKSAMKELLLTGYPKSIDPTGIAKHIAESLDTNTEGEFKVCVLYGGGKTHMATVKI